MIGMRCHMRLIQGAGTVFGGVYVRNNLRLPLLLAISLCLLQRWSSIFIIALFGNTRRRNINLVMGCLNVWPGRINVRRCVGIVVR